MQSIHNPKNSQRMAVTLTIILEVLFAFLGGWTLFDVFISWGLVPAIIIGALTGLVLLLLYLYVFIYREYAMEAVKIFSFRRNESPAARLAWGIFLVCICVLMDSFFNANRMIGLPLDNPAGKAFIWLALQCLVFVPLALGKLVHAHVNVVDPTADRTRRLVNAVDENLFDALKSVLPTMNASELLAMKAGNLQPLHDRMAAIEAQRQQATQVAQDPLAQVLTQWINSQSQPTAPQIQPAAQPDVERIVRNQKAFDAQRANDDDLADSIGGGTASPLARKSAQNGHQ